MAGPAPWNFAINHKHVHTYHSHHSCINMPLCDKQEKIPQVSFHQQFLFRSEHLWSLCCTWCPSWKDAPRPVSILSLRSASKLSKAKKGNLARSHKLTLDRAYSTTAAQRSLRPQSLPKSFWFFSSWGVRFSQIYQHNENCKFRKTPSKTLGYYFSSWEPRRSSQCQRVHR